MDRATTGCTAAPTGWATTSAAATSWATLRGGDGADVLVGGWDGRKADAHRVPDTYAWSDATRGVVSTSREPPAWRPASAGTGSGSRRGWESPARRTATPSSAPTTAERINGLDGRDPISGRAGDDEIYGESKGGTGRDTILGGDGADLIGSYSGADKSVAAGQRLHRGLRRRPDTVLGDLGTDQVRSRSPPGPAWASTGGGGRDIVSLYGDQLEGNSPRTQFTVDLRDGTTSASLARPPKGTIGSRYEEYRLVGIARSAFYGTPGPDRVWTITGGELRAWTYGGNDWVRASVRNDTVNAGVGTDTVKGGEGDDVCRRAERGTC